MWKTTSFIPALCTLLFCNQAWAQNVCSCGAIGDCLLEQLLNEEIKKDQCHKACASNLGQFRNSVESCLDNSDGLEQTFSALTCSLRTSGSCTGRFLGDSIQRTLPGHGKRPKRHAKGNKFYYPGSRNFGPGGRPGSRNQFNSGNGRSNSRSSSSSEFGGGSGGSGNGNSGGSFSNEIGAYMACKRSTCGAGNLRARHFNPGPSLFQTCQKALSCTLENSEVLYNALQTCKRNAGSLSLRSESECFRV